MRTLSALLTFIIIGIPVSAAQAQCFRVALLDERGTVITPGGLVTAIKIGSDNIFTYVLPAHHEQKVVGPVACPREVTDPILNLYNLSCLSEQAMRQASVTNSQSVLVVRQRCQELASALQTATVAP